MKKQSYFGQIVLIVMMVVFVVYFVYAKGHNDRGTIGLMVESGFATIGITIALGLFWILVLYLTAPFRSSPVVETRSVGVVTLNDKNQNIELTEQEQFILDHVGYYKEAWAIGRIIHIRYTALPGRIITDGMTQSAQTDFETALRHLSSYYDKGETFMNTDEEENDKGELISYTLSGGFLKYTLQVDHEFDVPGYESDIRSMWVKRIGDSRTHDSTIETRHCEHCGFANPLETKKCAACGGNPKK